MRTARRDPARKRAVASSARGRVDRSRTRRNLSTGVGRVGINPGPVRRPSTPTAGACQPSAPAGSGRRERAVSATPPRQSASTVGPAPETTAATPSARSESTRARDSRHRRRAGTPGAAVTGRGDQVVRRARRAPPPAGRPAPAFGGRVGVRHRRRAAGRARARSPAASAARRPPPEPRVDGRAGARVPGVGLATADDQAAEAAPGRRCPDGPRAGRQREEPLVGSRTAPSSTQGPGQRQPAHDRGRRRAEPAGVRDALRQCSRTPGGVTCIAAKRRPHRPHHEVGLVEGERRRALPLDLDTRPSASASAVSSSRRSSARPRESKPGPRLALVAGTLTRHGALDEPHAAHS